MDDSGFLRSHGFNRVADAPDGLKAWEALELRTLEPAACDGNLPHLGGLGLLRRVRANPGYLDLSPLMVTIKASEQLSEALPAAGLNQGDGPLPPVRD